MRKVETQDINKYVKMVNMYIGKYFIKNWKEASFSDTSIVLGNTSLSIDDIRQTLMMEVIVGLQNYNPDYRTANGSSVKESTFIYRHLYFRSGSLAKKLSTQKHGYGVWMSPIETYIGDEYD